MTAKTDKLCKKRCNREKTKTKNKQTKNTAMFYDAILNKLKFQNNIRFAHKQKERFPFVLLTSVKIAGSLRFHF